MILMRTPLAVTLAATGIASAAIAQTTVQSCERSVTFDAPPRRPQFPTKSI